MLISGLLVLSFSRRDFSRFLVRHAGQARLQLDVLFDCLIFILNVLEQDVVIKTKHVLISRSPHQAATTLSHIPLT